jgi:hypothetical protein
MRLPQAAPRASWAQMDPGGRRVVLSPVGASSMPHGVNFGKLPHHEDAKGSGSGHGGGDLLPRKFNKTKVISK